MSVRDNIERGAAFLDEHAPGWRSRIDFDSLNMYTNCIADQAFKGVPGVDEKGYEHARHILGYKGGLMADYGFVCAQAEDWKEYLEQA